MRHWSDEERAEYDIAVHVAWSAGRNDRERAEKFAKIVADAVQAQRRWAVDTLNAAQHDGLWRRLKEHHRKIDRLTVNFAGRSHAVPSIGGIARKTGSSTEYQQLAFADMSRDELLEKSREYEVTAFAARRNKHLVSMLIELIDTVPGARTAREAASSVGLDVERYLAVAS